MRFKELESGFRAARASSRLNGAVGRWSLDDPRLSRYEDADLVIEHHRDTKIPYAAKNATTIALCRLVAEGDDMATLLLFELYMPSLRNIFSKARTIAEVPVPDDELQEAAVEGLLLAATGMDATDPKPSGTLRAKAQGEVDKRLRVAKRRGAAEIEPQPEPEVKATGVEEEWFEVVGAKETLREAVSRRIISADDAELIASTRLGDESLAEAAARLGKTKIAVNQRRLRAEAKLQGWLVTTGRLPSREESEKNRRDL